MDAAFLYGLTSIASVCGVYGLLTASRKSARIRESDKKIARLKEENERLIEQGKASGAADAAQVRELEAQIERLGTTNKELTTKAETLTKRESELAAREKELHGRVDEAYAAARKANEAAEAAVVAKDKAIAEGKTAEANVEAKIAEAVKNALETAATNPANSAETITTIAALDDTALVAMQTELEAVRAELAGVQAELATTKTELTEAVSERERIEEEMEKRFERIQAFAEKQVGKLQEENRALKAAAANIKPSSSGPETADGAERFHSLTALAPYGVFEADGDGKWTVSSEAWSRISGLTTEESKGDGWKKPIHEADIAGVEEAWNIAVTAGSTFARTFRLVTADGTLRWVAVRTTSLVKGDALGFLGVVEDITERRRAEEAVKSSALCLRSVVEAAMEGIVLLNQNGSIVSWNRSAETLFGYAESQAVGKSLLALFTQGDHDTLRGILTKAAQQDSLHTPQTASVTGTHHDGNIFPVEIALSAWRSADADDAGADTFYTATIRDVSERLRTEDMRRAKENAEEANRSKSQFMANMSHELRTPLNAIIGFSEILHDRTFGDLTPKQDRYVGNILTSGRHLLQLINDVLDLAKVEAGNVEMEYIAFPFALAVRNIDSLVRAQAAAKNITFDTNVPTDLPVLIADQAKVKQVLYNLVGNAIKFTPDNGAVLVTAEAVDGGKTLRVTVQDTGIGINAADQERIFREFEQLENSYVRAQQGTGLGLALSQRFVQMHGGRIWVESEGEGKGSAFHFEIPFAPAEEEGEEVIETVTASNVNEETVTTVPSAPAPVRPVAVGDRPIVLVVDDDQAASELLTHHLQGAGYVVSRAFTGNDAVMLAREMNPSVITLDLQLPDREGWDVLEELKGDAATRDIPVLVVSIEEDRERAASLGAADCFVKPVVKDALLIAIGREVTLRAKRSMAKAKEAPARETAGSRKRGRGGA